MLLFVAQSELQPSWRRGGSSSSFSTRCSWLIDRVRSVFSVLTEPFRGAGVGDLAAIIPRRAGDVPCDVHSHRSHGPLTSKREAVTSLDYARSKEGRNFPIRNPYIGVFIPIYAIYSS